MANRDDYSDQKMPGLSGTASAFQSGMAMRGKQKDKPPSEAKSGAKKRSGLGGLIQTGIEKLKGGKKAAPAAPTAEPGYEAIPGLKSMKHGGRVKKTGVHLLHKGEYVVPAKHSSRKRPGHKKTVTKL